MFQYLFFDRFAKPCPVIHASHKDIFLPAWPRFGCQQSLHRRLRVFLRRQEQRANAAHVGVCMGLAGSAGLYIAEW